MTALSFTTAHLLQEIDEAKVRLSRWESRVLSINAARKSALSAGAVTWTASGETLRQAQRMVALIVDELAALKAVQASLTVA